MSRHDAEFTEYLNVRLPWLRRVAYLLCQDWPLADDLVQAAVTRMYLRWSRIRGLEHVDAYARVVLVREFLGQRRSAWARRVSLPGEVPEAAVREDDADLVVDMRRALAGLPPGQRATARRDGGLRAPAAARHEPGSLDHTPRGLIERCRPRPLTPG
jgi:DNA-directed RNA polymerase specialized sigma24 family protein